GHLARLHPWTSRPPRFHNRNNMLAAKPERSKMTKTQAKSAKSALASAQIEVGLACDVNTSLAGIHGLTDLFKYANDFAAKRRNGGGLSPIRITHWRADDGNREVRCAYDSCPGSPHSLNVLVVPGNEQATLKPVEDGPLIRWLCQQHDRGAVIAGV